MKVVSDTVEFKHDYLKVPDVSTDNRIVHGLQVMASAISNAPPPTSTSIDTLKMLFKQWRASAPPAIQCQSNQSKQTSQATPPANLDRCNSPFYVLEENGNEDDNDQTTPTVRPLHIPIISCKLTFYEVVSPTRVCPHQHTTKSSLL